MTDSGLLEPYLILIALIAIITYLEKKIAIPGAILLVPLGIVLSFVPGFPGLQLDPTVALSVFLPPLVYVAAAEISWQEFIANLRPIALLAIGLVLFTTLIVAIVAHQLLPSLSWPVCFVLGAVVSPPDDVATVAIAGKLGIPRRLVTIIKGEGLVNDATALIAFKYAVIAVSVGSFSLSGATLSFVIIAVGELLYGAAIGWLCGWIRQKIDEPGIEITVSLLTPFAAYLLPQALGGSGVLATVAAGLYYSWQGPKLVSSSTRLQLLPVWDMITLLLNGLLFLLTGLELRSILASRILFPHISNLLLFGLAISLVVILVRFLWLVPATLVPRALSRKLREHDPTPPWRLLLILGWTGIRGAISLAAALAIPFLIGKSEAFPARNLIIFTTFCVIVVTLVIQGLTLPFIIRWLKVDQDGAKEIDAERREELATRIEITRHALEKIAQLGLAERIPPVITQELASVYEARLSHLEAHLEGRERKQYKRLLSLDLDLQNRILRFERDYIIKLRDENRITDNTLRDVEYDLDLRETRLQQGILAEDSVTE